MKNLMKYSLVAFVAAMAFTACSDDDNYSGPGEWNAAADYADVYFKSASGTVELDPTEPTTTSFDIYRRVKHEYTWGKDSEGNDSIIGDKIVTALPAITVPMEVVDNTEDVFTVSDAVFAEGDTVATVTVNFPKAEIGTTYTLKVKVTDPKFASYYSNSNIYTLNVARAKWNLLGTGTIEENFYIGGVGNTEIYQKDSEPNVFRLMHPLDDILAEAKADTEHWAAEEFDGSQPEYITVTVLSDGIITYPSFSTGCFHPTYGQTVWCHHPNRFSSLSDPSNWTFNKVLSFQDDGTTPGQLQLAPYYYMDGVGGWNNTQDNGIIVVTFPGYTPPYTPDLTSADDFSWEQVFEGMFVSEKLGTTTTAKLFKGKCIATQNDADKIFTETYGTPYRVESPYAEGYDLYFAIDKDGGITMPEGCELQPTGLYSVGTPVYAKIIIPESSYIENFLVLGVQFQNESGSLVYGKSEEKLMNLTYTELGKGTYTYDVEALSDGAGSFYEGSEDATLFQCDQLPGNFFLKPWAKSDEGLNFTIGSDGKIRFYQYTGEAYGEYGDVYFIDLEAYNPNYTDYLGEYDEETKTYSFSGIYYIPGAGGFGLITETFTLNGAAARAKAPLTPARHNSMKLAFKKYQASLRFTPSKETVQFNHGSSLRLK